MTEVTTDRAVRTLEVRYLGRIGYAEAVRLQEKARHRLIDGRGEEQLLLLEHPSVYTLGRNADLGDLVATPEWLAAHRVSVEETDRGGEITYHGPGQLVGYPILDLNPDGRDIRRYICDLQRLLILTLADFDLEAEPGLPDRPAGVWVGSLKIASIGVHLRAQRLDRSHLLRRHRSLWIGGSPDDLHRAAWKRSDGRGGRRSLQRPLRRGLRSPVGFGERRT